MFFFGAKRDFLAPISDKIAGFFSEDSPYQYTSNILPTWFVVLLLLLLYYRFIFFSLSMKVIRYYVLHKFWKLFVILVWIEFVQGLFIWLTKLTLLDSLTCILVEVIFSVLCVRLWRRFQFLVRSVLLFIQSLRLFLNFCSQYSQYSQYSKPRNIKLLRKLPFWW